MYIFLHAVTRKIWASGVRGFWFRVFRGGFWIFSASRVFRVFRFFLGLRILGFLGRLGFLGGFGVLLSCLTFCYAYFEV